MRLFTLALTAALAMAACGGAAQPAPTTAPTAALTAAPTVAAPTSTAAAAVIYKAELKSSNENPPVQGAEATCAGNATITVTGGQAKFDVTVTGCPATISMNVAHIMEGGIGTNGPVRVDTTLKAGEFTLTGGAGTFSRTVPIDPAIAALIAANPAAYYFNIHSTANGGGVTRGQLVKG